MAAIKPITTMTGDKPMRHVTKSGNVLTQMEFNKFSKASKKGGGKARKGKHMSSSAKLKMVKSRAKNSAMGVNSKGVKLKNIAVKKGKAIKSAVKPITTMSTKSVAKRRK